MLYTSPTVPFTRVRKASDFFTKSNFSLSIYRLYIKTLRSDQHGKLYVWCTFKMSFNLLYAKFLGYVDNKMFTYSMIEIDFIIFQAPQI